MQWRTLRLRRSALRIACDLIVDCSCRSYSSFFSPPLSVPTASILIFSPFLGPSFTSPALNVKTPTIPSLTIPITLAQAMAQTLILILPSGALGNDKIHSAGYGTQPRGSQNMAWEEKYMLHMNWRPCVLSQRRAETMRSKEARKDWAERAVHSWLAIFQGHMRIFNNTLCIIFLLRLVMLSP